MIFPLKKGSRKNSGTVAGVLYLTEPATFAVEQLRSGRSVFSSEEVLIDKRASRGLPLVMALLDDVVTEVYLCDDPKPQLL